MSVSAHEMELLERQIGQAHRAAVQSQLNAAGLGEIGHPMLLSILRSNDTGDREGRCHAQRDLAELLHISPAAVANSLKSLERGGYIRREPGEKDARRNQVLLTEKGKQAVEGCQQVFERVTAQMLEGFSPEEKALLCAFRTRMLRNLRGEAPAQKEES